MCVRDARGACGAPSMLRASLATLRNTDARQRRQRTPRILQKAR